MNAFLALLREQLWSRWGLAIVFSFVSHIALAMVLLRLEQTNTRQVRPRRTVVRLIRKKKVRRILPRRTIPKPKKRKKPRPKKKKRPRKRKKPRLRKPRLRKKRKRARGRRRRPPTNPTRRPPPKTSADVQPIFGVSMNSLSQKPGGRKMALNQGNTVQMDPRESGSGKVQPYRGRPGVAGAPQGTSKDVFVPIPDFELDAYPQETRKVSATYPSKAKAEELQAVVVLSVEVRKNGRVRRVRVISVRPKRARKYGFGRAAARALKRYRFRPGKFKGRAVDAVIRYTYRFEVSD